MAGVALLSANGAQAAPPAPKADRQLDRALERLVSSEAGPPAAIAIVQRRGERRVHTAGVANLNGERPPRRLQHVRAASVSKAFSGAAALSLIDEGLLSLDETIGARLPDLPTAWHPVTLRQALAHTSGLPEFTGSEDFIEAFLASPQQAPPPAELLAFVADQPLEFMPGTQYRYSNSDNVVVALMIEAATGARYEQVLRDKVLGPLRLRRTRMPAGVLMPRPFLRGYDIGEAGAPEDVSQIAAWGGWAWASGGLVSTPGNLNRFVRAYVGGRLFGQPVRRQQRRMTAGARSEPPGPGRNDAGLALFRYRTACGTMFGHTGSISGYTQLIAASRNGRRSLTFTISTQVSDELLSALRRAQRRAVCAALARR